MLPVLSFLYHPPTITYGNNVPPISTHVGLIVLRDLVGGEELVMLPVCSVITSSLDHHFLAAVTILNNESYISGIDQSIGITPRYTLKEYLPDSAHCQEQQRLLSQWRGQ